MDNIPDIIIIRGAPGSGKSQTAKSLAKNFPKGVRLEVDKIREMVISVKWEDQKEHIEMLQISSKLVLEFLNFGYKPVIVIDTFSGDKVNNFIEILGQNDKNFSIQLFGLFTTDIELKKRLSSRTNQEYKDFQVCKKLNDDVLKWKPENEFQIDTSGLTPFLSAGIMYNKIIEKH